MILTTLIILIIVCAISFLIVEKSNADKLNSLFSVVGGVSFLISILLTIISIIMSFCIFCDSTKQSIKRTEVKMSIIEDKISKLPDDHSDLEIIKLTAEYSTVLNELNKLHSNYDTLDTAKWWLYFGHNN